VEAGVPFGFSEIYANDEGDTKALERHEVSRTEASDWLRKRGLSALEIEVVLFTGFEKLSGRQMAPKVGVSQSKVASLRKSLAVADGIRSLGTAFTHGLPPRAAEAGFARNTPCAGKSLPEIREGRPISPVQLAKLLKPFGISPRDVRLGTEVLKGYHAEDFAEACARYLPPADGNATPATNQ
jgi:hypothetical protein